MSMIYDVFKSYIKEFEETFSLMGDKSNYYILNQFFMSVDSEIYYSLIRYYRPKKIIEVGAGFSTILAWEALNKNTGSSSELIAIEPKPSKRLEAFYKKKFLLLKEEVQDMPLSLFKSLNIGDILFIDSSHVYTSGSDVEFLFKNVLPILQPGILIHFHDIVLPSPCNEIYGSDWNEQDYVKPLIDSEEYRVLWYGSKIYLEDEQSLIDNFKSYKHMKEKFPKSRPSSLWLVKNY